MYVWQSLHGHSLGFPCFVVILKAGSESIDLILSGSSSQVLGVKYANDWVPLYIDFTVMVYKVYLFPEALN